MKKGFIPLRTPCLLILWVPLSLFFFMPKVYAGGYDEAIHSPADPSLPPGITSEQLSTINRSSKPPVISSNWNLNKWGKSKWLNKNVCRENQGNVICFRPQIAKQLGWRIPSKSNF